LRYLRPSTQLRARFGSKSAFASILAAGSTRDAKSSPVGRGASIPPRAQIGEQEADVRVLRGDPALTGDRPKASHGARVAVQRGPRRVAGSAEPVLSVVGDKLFEIGTATPLLGYGT